MKQYPGVVVLQVLDSHNTNTVRAQQLNTVVARAVDQCLVCKKMFDLTMNDTQTHWLFKDAFRSNKNRHK